MAKRIKFPLEMADGSQVRNLDELREHFDLETVLEYYKSGRLLTWLRDRYFDDEAAAVEELDEQSPDFQQNLCGIFGVPYTGEAVDLEEISRRQERLERLRTFTDEAEFIDHIDQVAFDQEDLADLLDEEETTIYLCGEKFTVPASRKGVKYVGINSPSVHISGKLPEEGSELGIEFVFCNVDNLSTYKAREEKLPEPALNLDEASDKAFLAFADEDGCHVCVETENYLLYLDREIGWDSQTVNKHLYDKRTGKDTVKMLKRVGGNEKILDAIKRDRETSGNQTDNDEWIHFISSSDVLATYEDTIYCAVRTNTAEIPEIAVFRYDPCTDSCVKILNYCADGDLVATNNDYFAFIDVERGLCLLNIQTGEKRQILIKGEKIARCCNGLLNFLPYRLSRLNTVRMTTKSSEETEIYLATALSMSKNELYIATTVGVWQYDIFTKTMTEIVSDDLGIRGFIFQYSNKLCWGDFTKVKCMAQGDSQPDNIKTIMKGSILSTSKYKNGILIASEESGQPLYFLNLDTEKLSPLGSGGAWGKWLGLKVDNGFLVVGQSVYFRRKNGDIVKIRMNQPGKPILVPRKDDSGRRIAIAIGSSL